MKFEKLLKTALLCSAVVLISCGDNVDPNSQTDTTPPPSPGIVISSATSDFVFGEALDMDVTSGPQSHNVSGWVRVEENGDHDNIPTVTVNGQTATVGANAFAEDCPSTAPFLCFQFDTTLSLDRGEHDITATAMDTKGNTYTDSISGIVDVCRKGGFEADVPALFQTNPMAAVMQNNRCHEIDGCSVYITEADPLATSQTRNNPSSINNSLRASSTAFGSGEVPPNSEYLVHGQMPTDVLPCNIHDVCYQTIGSTQEQCDNQMLAGMMAVCEQAYPGDCPPELSSLECLEWKGQRETCEAFANSYFVGLTAVGTVAFDERQAEYQ